MISLAFLFAAAVALPAPAYSQLNRSSISGFVFDETRRPIPQVIVELRNEFTSIARVRTDGSGHFYFRGLLQGRYSVRALPLGTEFSEQTQDVEIAGIGVRGQPLAESVQRDFYLRPRKRPDPLPKTTAVLFAQEVPKAAEDLYKAASADLEQKRMQAGVENLEKAIAAFPDYFAALHMLGSIRMSEKRFADAIDIFSKAAAVNDRCFDCWFGLSFSQYTVKEYVESTVSGEKAVFLKPDSVEANLLLGMAYRLSKNFGKAESFLKQASKISEGESAEVHWNLALLYGKDLNRFAEAAKELELYLKVAGEIPNEDEIKKLIKHFKAKAAERRASKNYPLKLLHSDDSEVD